MDIPTIQKKPRALLYRISIKGQTPLDVAHFGIEEAREHAATMANLGEVTSIERVKKCKTCNEVRLLDEFSHHGWARNYQQSSCIICVRVRSRELAHKKRDEFVVKKIPPIDSVLVRQFLRGALAI